MIRPAASERELHIAAVAYLRRALPDRVLWTHPANGEHRDKRTAALIKAFGQRPGMPDLILWFEGRTLAIEFKAGRNKLTPEQSAVADAIVNEHGGAFAECRSVEDVERFLRREGVPLRASVLAVAA